jgi:hypothetical protein
MAKFTVLRYLLIETEVEADSAEEALSIEEDLPLTGDLNSEGALNFSWALSDAMGSWVCDDQDNVILENY